MLWLILIKGRHWVAYPTELDAMCAIVFGGLFGARIIPVA